MHQQSPILGVIVNDAEPLDKNAVLDEAWQKVLDGFRAGSPLIGQLDDDDPDRQQFLRCLRLVAETAQRPLLAPVPERQQRTA